MSPSFIGLMLQICFVMVSHMEITSVIDSLLI